MEHNLIQFETTTFRKALIQVLSAKAQKLLERPAYKVGREFVVTLSNFLFSLDEFYHHPIPTGPKILAVNHPSTTDPFLALRLVKEPMSILIEETLFDVPVFGKILALSGHIKVVKSDGQRAYEQAREALLDGKSVAIYIEGLISPLEGGFHPPKTGPVRLAIETGAPVVPIGVHIQRKRLKMIKTKLQKKDALGTWYLDGPYAMTIGEPVYLDGDIHDRENVRASSDHIMEQVIELAGQSAERIKNRGYRRLRRVSAS